MKIYQNKSTIGKKYLLGGIAKPTLISISVKYLDFFNRIYIIKWLRSALLNVIYDYNSKIKFTKTINKTYFKNMSYLFKK
jgi:hypothetical protein